MFALDELSPGGLPVDFVEDLFDPVSCKMCRACFYCLHQYDEARGRTKEQNPGSVVYNCADSALKKEKPLSLYNEHQRKEEKWQRLSQDKTLVNVLSQRTSIYESLQKYVV